MPAPEYGGYVTAHVDGKPVAGLMAHPIDRWNTYLHTADVDATLARVIAAGGTGCGGAWTSPPPRAGWPWSPIPAEAWSGCGSPPVTPPARRSPAWPAPPVWHQLTTLDLAKVLDFYVQVFGWQTEVAGDTDEFRYSTAVFDGEPLIGVMDGTAFMSAGEPSNWFFFLGADDVDKTQRLIVDNGGAVVRAAEDTPYGRLASVTTPPARDSTCRR